MRLAVFASVLAWSVAASADGPSRMILDWSAIPSGRSVDVHTNVGLAGAHEGRAPPAWAVDSTETLTKCLRARHASIDGSELVEIITVGDQEYLDRAVVDTFTDPSKLVVTSHQRHPVARVATLGEVGVWAWREGDSLHVGAFGDLGFMSHAMVSFGCRWREIVLTEDGGNGEIVSEPSMSDPPSDFNDGDHPPPPKATGPSFSIAVSVSRSSADAKPLVVVRARLTSP